PSLAGVLRAGGGPAPDRGARDRPRRPGSPALEPPDVRAVVRGVGSAWVRAGTRGARPGQLSPSDQGFGGLPPPCGGCARAGSLPWAGVGAAVGAARVGVLLGVA